MRELNLFHCFLFRNFLVNSHARIIVILALASGCIVAISAASAAYYRACVWCVCVAYMHAREISDI